jgi:two-component system response regulator MprA
MKRGDAWVLVVDDDEDIRDTIGACLELFELRSVGAADGQRALECLRRSEVLPSAILLDLRMPGLSGPDVVHQLKGEPRLGAIPVIILSGDSRAAEVSRELGAATFLRKPVDLDELVDTVRRFA